MSYSLLLSFPENIFLAEASTGNFVLHAPDIEIPLQKVSAGLMRAIEHLLDGEATEETLSAIAIEYDGIASLPQLYYYLQQFTQLGLLCHKLSVDGSSLATLAPLAAPYPFQWSEAQCDRQYVISRFAYCHRDKERMVWETPLFPGKIILHDWRGAAIASELSQPQNCQSLTKIPDISLEAAQSFLSLLLSAKVISQVTEDGEIEGEASPNLVQWEFHDLLFHSQSRQGRHDKPVGKSKRFLGKIDPPPALKPKRSYETIPLARPDLERLQQSDRPFTQVLETRKSIRVWGTRAISDRQLGEFLYRCFRVREIIPTTDIELSDRPYPSGGASYEIEVYLAIERCENIAAGLYHYCPQAHVLEKIAEKTDEVKTLLENAGKATGEDNLPQVLIILAARFGRVSWAYESVAYSLILKHVGVLYQTMYLVATAMDLAPCAIGAGNSTLFATIADTDYYSESSVGEFILGSQ